MDSNNKNMNGIIMILLLMGTLLAACHESPINTDNGIARNDFPELAGDYLGQKTPGSIPEIFAPFLVSDSHNIHSSLVFHPNQKEAYFSIYPGDGSPQKICVTAEKKGIWRQPEFLSSSDEYDDGGPVITNQGKRMFFYSNRPLIAGKEVDKDEDIWFVNRKGSKWGQAIHAGNKINSDQPEAFLYPGKNGSLFFSKIFGPDSNLLMQSYREKGKFQEPIIIKNIGDSIDFHQPVTVRGEDYFIFTKNTKIGKYYYASLSISFKNNDGTWTVLKDMGDMINYGEGRFPSISPDGKYLFFVSYRTGVSKFYWVDAKIIDYLRTNDLNLIARLTDEINKESFMRGKELYEDFKVSHKDYYCFDEKILSETGLNLLKVEEFKKALEVFLFNQTLYPNIGLVYENLGDGYWALNRLDEAKTNYQKFLGLEPDNIRAREKLGLLAGT